MKTINQKVLLNGFKKILLIRRVEEKISNRVTQRIIGDEKSVITDSELKPTAPVREQATQAPFFKSNDLIDVISENINHNQVKGPDDSYFKVIIEAIEGKLGEFKLEGKIINVLKGPVVDTFELEHLFLFLNFVYFLVRSGHRFEHDIRLEKIDPSEKTSKYAKIR